MTAQQVRDASAGRGPQAQMSVLDSGLTILTRAMEHLETVAVGVWVAAGARHEAAALHGAAHFLEHMAFKGTAQRTAQDIARQIEGVGGYINAATGHETTAYYARILREDLPLAVDILADVLQHPAFDAQEMAREREVIVQEIAQSLDTPEDLVCDGLLEAAYGTSGPGRPILGTPETVRALDGAALRGYMDAHYGGPGLVLAAAGGMAHAEVVALAEEHFAALPSRTAAAPEPARFRAGERQVARPVEQMQVALAFAGPGHGDRLHDAAQVFSVIFGGGMSSRLFQEVRERRGLCYAVSSLFWPFADTGLIGFSAGCAAAQAAELMTVAGAQLQRMAEDVTEEETRRARAQLRAGLLMSLESATACAGRLAQQQLCLGRVREVPESLARLEAVDAASVRRLAQELRSAAPALAVVGPHGALAPEGALAARFAAG